MERIGVRELRQHASRYLSRVADGETIEVTDRGRPVALLVPVPREPWEEMVAAGRVKPASDPMGLGEEPPGDYSIDASGALEAIRADER